MAKKIYNGELNDSMDWGDVLGDGSMVASGKSVQDYIKSKTEAVSEVQKFLNGYDEVTETPVLVAGAVQDGAQDIYNTLSNYKTVGTDGYIKTNSSSSYVTYQVRNIGFTHVKVKTVSGIKGTNVFAVLFSVPVNQAIPEGWYQSNNLYSDSKFIAPADSLSQNTVFEKEYELPDNCSSVYVTKRSGSTDITMLAKTFVSGVDSINDIRVGMENNAQRNTDITEYLSESSGEVGVLKLRDEIKEKYPQFVNPAANRTNATNYDDCIGYLEKKIASIPKGKHFIWITDTHWQDSPYKNVYYILDYVRKRIGGCKVFFGGDAINSEKDKYKALAALSEYTTEHFLSMGKNSLWIIGNHDCNVLGLPDGYTNEDKKKVLINAKPLYDLTIKNIENEIVFDESRIERISQLTQCHKGDISTTDLYSPEEWAELKEGIIAWMKFHYRYDDHIQKIRHIVLETGCGCYEQSILLKTIYDTNVFQLSWLAEELLSTPSGYDVVVHGHMTASNADHFYSSDDNTSYFYIMRGVIRKEIVTINVKAANTTEGNEVQRILCGENANRSFDLRRNNFNNRIFAITGHFHSDFSRLFSYFPDKYDRWCFGYYRDANSGEYYDRREGAVVCVSVCCNNSHRDSWYGEGTANYSPRENIRIPNTVNEVLFDVFTIGEDNKIYTTRIGAGGDRVYNLMPNVDADGNRIEGIDDEDLDKGCHIKGYEYPVL